MREKALLRTLQEEQRKARQAGTPGALCGIHLRPSRSPTVRRIGVAVAALWLGIIAVSGVVSVLGFFQALR